MGACGETCGLLAASIASISFGSYGVPMKGESATSVDVDPFVFQTYKSVMLFVTSFIILLGNGALDADFTPWGIVSATFWVPAGTAGVYAVRRAGLAVSVGIWSSVIVCVSFIWGLVIFQERINSIWGAASASMILCFGLCGISFYSSPGHQRRQVAKNIRDCSVGNQTAAPPIENDSGPDFLPFKNHRNTLNTDYGTIDPGTSDTHGASALLLVNDTYQYRLGLCMACLNGFLAASIMVPLHYAGENAKGIRFTFSFGIGAVIVTSLLWLSRFAYHAMRLKSCRSGFNALPSFHFYEMWKPGCLAGILYSIGHISSTVAITCLGDFIGYSLGQSSLLVSGLWGVFWYREVVVTGDIIGFFVSCCIAICGILWLGYEHHNAK